MNQPDIIRDLVHWLDKHLEQPLSLDHVAAKSGYSKWHLQRMFKEVTGQAVGTYIRKRRLTNAATALRLTNRPILEIALQYHFDSQQTFTRAFKKQFQYTPAYYRRMEHLETSGLCPPIDLTGMVIPQPEYITLPERVLIGVTRDYSCSLKEIIQTYYQTNAGFWVEYLNGFKRIPTILYGLHHVLPSKKSDDVQDVFYTTAVDPKEVPEGARGEKIILAKTDYVKFTYRGTAKGLSEYLMAIYTTALPMLKLTVCNDYRIEMFHNKTQQSEIILDDNITIECDYLIPIIK